MKTVKAIFLQEDKRRFSGKVLMDGQVEACYIASSSHLRGIISLENKEVILIPVESEKSSFRYALYAVKQGTEYVVVNTKVSNQVFEKALLSETFSFLGDRKEFKKEYTLEGYKSDFFLPKEKTVIEVKSLISLEERATFPIMYSERFKLQLEKILKLLQEGFSAYLFLISYGNETKKIYLDRASNNWPALERSLKAGLKIKAFACNLTETYEPQLFDKKIEIL